MNENVRCMSIVFLMLMCQVASADDWPQWRGPGRDGVWKETGIIDSFEAATIKRRWSVPISSGYNGPTVAEGRVYVADRITEPQEAERVHCFEWQTGKRLWSYSYECEYKIQFRAGPRASVTVHDGRAYALGSMGHLHAFDAATGELLWKKDPMRDFKARVPVWGIAAAPLVEGDLLIVMIGGADDACVVALDRRTGKRVWSALSDELVYSAPVVIEQGGKRVLVCWTAKRLVGFNPTTGVIHWEHPYKFSRWVDGVVTPVRHGDRLFVSAFMDGALMLKLDDQLKVKQLWRRKGQNEKSTAALHCLMSNPLMTDTHIYGVDAYGQFRCLAADTGDRVWEDTTVTTQTRWGTAHMVRHGDRTWIFNDIGELIIARLAADGYHEISRAKLIEPTKVQLKRRNGVTWAHPAFAYKHVFARNDKELICASLAAPDAAER